MLAIKNAKVLTVTKGIIERGMVIINEGKIDAVGKDIFVPANAEVIDAAGKWLTPGFIDAHTHPNMREEPTTMDMIGDFNEITNPITPFVRAEDAFNPNHPAYGKMRRAGFTSGCVLPGSGNIIGGTGICYKNHVGDTLYKMIIPGTEQMKMAMGENPRYLYGEKGQMPMTRMGIAAMLREALVNAKKYSDKLIEGEKDSSKKPERDFKLEALVPVVRGEMRCRIHAHRADDIITAVRICREFCIDFTIEHATDGKNIAKYLADNNIRCIVGPLLLRPLKQEVWNISLDTPRVLDEAGVDICLTQDASSDTQWLPMNIGCCIAKGGLSFETAMRAVTINPAKVLKLEDRIGSIEVGKDADLAIWSGDPFNNYTLCEATIIDGIVYKD